MLRRSGRTRIFTHILNAITVAFALVNVRDAMATTIAGRTPGTFAVSPTGAAAYTIPIWAPAGPNGLQPHMALVYNSQSGSGHLGIGWGLAGLSSIYRCNLTYAQDGIPGAITLATSDGLCLDGQRLRLTSGAYGLAGSTYQTEIANFANVTASGTAGNGPAYFTVKGRDGLTYTYGNSTDSRVLATGTQTALSWQLNLVSDRAGNTMKIVYSQATGSAAAVTISWTPSSHGSSTYNYTMTFSYSTNVPQSSYYGYAAGTVVTDTNLLGSITIAYSGTTVKKYVLSYQTSTTTGRDELIRVQECSDSAATNCLSPTQITYQNGTAGVSTQAITFNAVPNYSKYDFNGDGYADLMYVSGTTWVVAFGAASGFGAPVSTTISSSTKVMPADLLGNGKVGLLVNNSGTWYYYTWNGSAFVGSSTTLAYDSNVTTYVLADVNGDGRPDLVELVATTQVVIYVQLNVSSGSSMRFGGRITAYTYTQSQVVQAQIAGGLDYGLRGLDFNGDGRQDLYFWMLTVYQGNYTWSGYELLSGGTFFQTYPLPFPSNSIVSYLNWNSDACTDFLVNNNTIYIAGCNGSTPSTISLPAGVIGYIDWDGDGRTDLLALNGSTVGVYLSTGNGFGPFVSTSLPHYANGCFAIDANGDGLDDLACLTSSGTMVYYLHNGAGHPPDLVSSIADGFVNSVSPTYVSLVQNNYTKRSDAGYPYQDYIGPKYVVSSTTFSDPGSATGTTYNQSFWYYGAWTNLQGRGWQSFYAQRMIDSRNGLYYFNYFERAFPATGMIFENTLSTSSATLVTTINTPPTSWTELSATTHQERWFPYFTNTTTTRKEFGGTENGALITTTSTDYRFDNYGNPTSITTTLTDNDPGSPPPYLGQSWTTTTTNTPDIDTTHWCVSLLTQTQVVYTSTLSGSNSVTRTKSFTPDTTNCQYTEIVTEPNSATFKVTEDLTYDSFGNIATDKLTGSGMGTASPASRTTTINWTTASATTGQFPMSVTGPSGAQTQFNYNFSYGLVSSVTDPNNVATSWQHTDGFGRKTRENHPDGTYITWTYQTCVNGIGCLMGTPALVVTRTLYNTDNSVQSVSTDYLDSIDRPLVANQVTLSGSYARNEVRYDSLGRLSERAFACPWSGLTTACQYWTTYSYDVLDRVYQIQRPTSASNSTPETTTYAYAGRTTTVTDPLSNSRTTVADVNGWPRQTKDAYGYTVTSGYDAAGSKTVVSDSLGNTLWGGTYNYGLAPYLATASDMDLGAWRYTVDALGEITDWKDAKNQSFFATYDGLSRPLTRTEPDLTTTWTWGSVAASHEIGKLASVATSSYSEQYYYDAVGRLSKQRITTGTSCDTNPYCDYDLSYNATSGLLDHMAYPQAPSAYRFTPQYQYQNGTLSQIIDYNAPTQVFWQANVENARGQITQETVNSGAHGIVVNRATDDVTGMVGSLTAGVGGGTGLMNWSFLYDAVANMTQRQNNNIGLTENVYYDAVYRLDHSTLNGPINLQMHYDAMGNITSRSDIASGGAWTYDATHKHQVLTAGDSSHTYTYDSNGNALTRNSYTTGWTSYNYPSSLASAGESVQLSYGPDRQRSFMGYTNSAGLEQTYYLGKLTEKVTTGSGTAFRYYIYVGDRMVTIRTRVGSSNTDYYVLSDPQNGLSRLDTSTGTEYVSISYAPFGNWRNASTWSGPPPASVLTNLAAVTRRGYTGQTMLGTMGLIHMNGRVEDAVTGRFLSPDPYVSDPASSQNYNRYSYVVNDPLSLRDPSGFMYCYHLVTEDPSNTTIIDLPDGMQEVVVTAGFAETEEVCIPDPWPAPGTAGSGGGTGAGKGQGTAGNRNSGGNTGDDKPQGNQTPCANSSGQGVLIQLAFTNANSSNMAIPGANHTFVIATDPTTSASYASRGGPGSGGAGPPGSGSFQLVGASGPYNASFRDYGSVTGVQTVGYVNAPYSQVTALMDNFAAAVNNNAVPYLGDTNNSNSYAGALLGEVGFWPPPTPAMNATGYGQDYKPIPNLVCTKP